MLGLIERTIIPPIKRISSKTSAYAPELFEQFQSEIEIVGSKGMELSHMVLVKEQNQNDKKDSASLERTGRKFWA